MSRLVLFTLALGLVLTAGLVAIDNTEEPPINEEKVVEQPVPLPPAEDDMQAVAMANTQFAFDIYGEFPEEGNLFFSPLSVSMALAMTSAGARGDTLSQMEDVLHLAIGQDRIHPALGALDRILESRQYLPEGLGEGFTLSLANSIWGQTGHEFFPGFLGVLEASYGAAIRLTDFASDPEAARQEINRWVEEETRDRIVDLVPPGAITPDTLIALVNAIYFKAPWASAFEKEDTTTEPFTLLGGSDVEAELMNQTEMFGYMQGEGFKAAEIDYNGHALSMLIILPDPGEFQAIAAELSPTLLYEVAQEMSLRHVILSIPKFRIEWGSMLNSPLIALGMRDAFDGSLADFTGMDSVTGSFIGAVIHKAFVQVDEAGTEAAAATAVIRLGAGPDSTPTYYEFRVDRPFFLFIRDKETGAVLFMGRVLDPS